MKIRYCTTRPDSAISWYRVAGVLQYLRHLDPTIETVLTFELNWDVLADTDILFISNPFERGQHDAACMAKDMNVKVWIDFDDDVLNVPVTHPNHKYFSDFNVKEVIWRTLEVADVVTVSTAAIKESFAEYNQNIFVIENAFNNYVLGLPEHSNNTEIIAWRGGETHWDDLVTVFQEMKKISQTRPEWIWNFIGREEDTRHITRFIPNSFHTGRIQHLLYYKCLKNIKPSIFIHPLVDNDFNRAKSNIAFIEATFAGACPIMPDLPEFDACEDKYNSPQGFYSTMIQNMNNSEIQEMSFQKNKKYIIENLLLSDINKKRLDVIKFLFEPKKTKMKLVQ